MEFYPNCITIHGYKRGIVMDIFRQRHFTFNNYLLNYILDPRKLLETNNKTGVKIHKELVESDYIQTFKSQHFKSTPYIANYNTRFTINIINVYISNNNNTLKNLLPFLKRYSIEAIQVVFNKQTSKHTIKETFKMLKFVNVEHVEVVFYRKYEINYIKEWLKTLDKIRFIIFVTDNKKYSQKFIEDFNFSSWLIELNPNRKVHLSFNINSLIFTESQKHHTYFNRKLYIGSKGEIKNAPECKDTFGNINDLSKPEDILPIIQSKEFQKYWFVHKEITDVCKDCEFRHMCVDNRVPHKRKENEWYHKIECNYNPYIAKWKGEEGYRTLEECGVISNENEFTIDHEKIATINEELWGEE